MTLARCPQFRVWFGSLLALAIGVFAWSPRGLGADAAEPSPKDRQITTSVLHLLKSEHLTRHPLDDEISKRCLGTFVKALDPLKMYFLESDIDEFKAQETDLDDLLKKGNVEFPYHVFQRYLRRLEERVKVAVELVHAEHDFTIDEEMVSDPDAATYARTEDEARELWRKRVKYELLVLRAEAADAQKPATEDGKPQKTPEDPRTVLTRRYQGVLKRMRQTDHNELLETYLSALTTSYDPHSQYMSPRTLEDFEILMRLNLDGIGASLAFMDGNTVVQRIVPGGAADKDGRLKPEDKIVGVGEGTDGALVDVVDMRVSDVVQLIRGKSGTVVRLQVIPAGETDRKVYDITRAKVELSDSEARGQVITQTRDGQTLRIGVIQLPSFYLDMKAAGLGKPEAKSATHDVQRLLEEFNKEHVDGVLIDLRRNGGGSLTEAVQLTGLFLDEGPVVQVKNKENRVQHYDDPTAGAVWNGPMVVLIDKESASASEIFAGAIQDYGRGVVVGDKSTHGKGTVQHLIDLGNKLFGIGNSPNLGALKVTIQKFYRPTGDSTQSRGVASDIELPSLSTYGYVGEAELDYALEFDRVAAVPFDEQGLVEKALVERLARQSFERRKNSEGFQKALRDIDRYLSLKDRKTRTLNEAKFLKERAELADEAARDENRDEPPDSTGPVFDTDNYYNREVLDITLDYLSMVRLALADK